MTQACFASLLLLALAPLALGQSSRTVSGVLIGDPGPHAVSTLVGPTEVEHCSPAIPFLVPRWDGRNDEGELVPWLHLRSVQVSIRYQLTVHGAGENVSDQVAGEGPADTLSGPWVVETGVRSFWTRALEPETEHGGASFNAYMAGGEALAAFDGTLDGDGLSGWTETHNGTPTATEWIEIGANREDLRAWAGAGSQVLTWRPEQHSVARGFRGHWRDWTTVAVRVLDVAPGAQVQVRYILDAPPIAGPYRVEAGPWADHGILSGAESALLDVPGVDDSSDLIGTVFQYAAEEGRWVGLENLSPFSATCGGSWNAGVRIEREDGTYLSGLWSNAGGGVGTFAPISAFDGGIDWEGSSGRETWTGSSWTYVRRSSWILGSPSVWDGDLRLVARVTHATMAPESVTPGGLFAWDGDHLLTGRVRALRFRRL